MAISYIEMKHFDWGFPGVPDFETFANDTCERTYLRCPPKVFHEKITCTHLLGPHVQAETCTSAVSKAIIDQP